MSEEMKKKKKMTKEEKEQLKQLKKSAKPGGLAKRDAITGVLFISPWIVGAILFLAYPLITSFRYALNNISITPLGMNFNFVGYGNFTQILLSESDFVTNLIDYVVSTVISVPIIVVFALIISMMLNQKIKGKGFFRLIFFLPVIIVSGPILGMLNAQGAGSITSIDTQAITEAIKGFMPAALATPISKLFENMVTILWYSGVQILIFLSALQKIDRSMYEAAKDRWWFRMGMFLEDNTSKYQANDTFKYCIYHSIYFKQRSELDYRTDKDSNVLWNRRKGLWICISDGVVVFSGSSPYCRSVLTCILS